MMMNYRVIFKIAFDIIDSRLISQSWSDVLNKKYFIMMNLIAWWELEDIVAKI